MKNTKKIGKLILIIIIGLAVIAVGAILIVNRSSTYVEQGIIAEDNEEYDHAITDYNRAIKLNPWNADAYLWRGRAYYYGEQNYDLSIADFTKAIKLRPDYYVYYLWRGRAYHQIKNYDLAIADFTEAIKIDSDSSYGGHKKFVERGDVYADKGDYKLAIDDYDRAIAEIDGTIASRNQLKEKFGGDDDDWDNSELYKWRSDIEKKLASVQSKQQRQKYENALPGTREYRAEEHYQRGLDYAYEKKNEIDLSGLSIREQLFALLYSGDLDKAIKEWEEALRIDPNHDDARSSLERVRAKSF